MEWTDGMIARLRELWDEGHTSPQIALKMGVTKNAVVGAVHRYNMSARPSPIIRNGEPRAPKPRAEERAARPTLATLTSLAAPVLAPAQPIAATRPVIIAATAPRQASGPRPGRVATCCWVEEAGPHRWTHCDSPSVAGWSYCAVHGKGLFIQVRDRREDAAR